MQTRRCYPAPSHCQILPFSTAMCFLSAVLLHLPVPKICHCWLWPLVPDIVAFFCDHVVIWCDLIHVWSCMTLRKSVTLYFMSAVPTILGNLFATSPNFAKFAFCSHNMSQRLRELEHCKTIDDMFHNLVDGFRMLSQAGELSCVSMPQLPVCYDRMFASSISLLLSTLLFIICHSILYIVFHSCLLYWLQVHFIHIYLMRSISVHLTLSVLLDRSLLPSFDLQFKWFSSSCHLLSLHQRWRPTNVHALSPRPSPFILAQCI